MTPPELQQLVRDFYLDRLALLLRHEAAAQLVTDYDVNNAYQYLISREETHISWLQHALLDLNGPIPPDPAVPAVAARRKGADAVRELAGEDARANQQFVEKWRDRVAHVSDARHKGMLSVILGEMLEHRRIFEQASEGRTDIIGTHLAINERVGKVLATRWVE